MDDGHQDPPSSTLEVDLGADSKQATAKTKKSILRVPRFRGSGSNAATPAAVDDSQHTARPGEVRRNEGQRTSIMTQFRNSKDEKVVGLKNYGLTQSAHERRRRMHGDNGNTSVKTLGSAKAPSPVPLKSIEEIEEEARDFATTNIWKLLFFGNLAAFKVMAYYLITLETVLGALLTTGLTCYWYFAYNGDTSWTGQGLDFILLAFAVTSPIAAALAMAFNRRERALIAIADFRSFSFHLYAAHCFWDWPDVKGGREGAGDVDWVEHCDAVLAQLIGIGDELARFLSLPTASRSRHRMTRSGRREAAKTMEAAFHLMESMSTQRVTRLILYSERLKKIGLPSGEVSRMRQYERFISNNIEQLRMVKMYRTPQALRSFARIFTLVLPPFYAPTYAQLARDVNSLGMGITFGIITVLCLTALFESLQVLEDPFTAFLALDGIDVREEFEVLHFAQLMNTRKLAFPDAPSYPIGRRAALTGMQSPSQHRFMGQPPVQTHHARHGSKVPSLVNFTDMGDLTLDEDSETGTDVDEHADVELGFVLDDEDQTFVRETAFADVDIDEATLAGTAHHHRRGLSRGFSSHGGGSIGKGVGLSRRRVWE